MWESMTQGQLVGGEEDYAKDRAGDSGEREVLASKVTIGWEARPSQCRSAYSAMARGDSKSFAQRLG